MSLLKLALPLLVLGFLPLAAMAQVPASDVQLSLGEIQGLIKEDNMMVVPYKGNATVDFTIKVGCSAFLQAEASGNNPTLDHIDLAVDDPPAWMSADSLDVPISNADCADPGVASNNGYAVLTGSYPFSVAAGAPGLLTQQVNLTASLESGASSDPMPLLFSVQFHPSYTIQPSVQFPLTVNGNSVNFTVTVTNNANARGMVMIEELHASTGQLSGLASVPYQPPETKTFDVQFKAPSTCWTNATVTFKSFAHFLLLDQRAGSYHDEVDHTWELKNGIACTPGKENTTKKSPVGGLVVLPVVLGAALLARRRIL